jgi:hypothetical protein
MDAALAALLHELAFGAAQRRGSERPVHVRVPGAPQALGRRGDARRDQLGIDGVGEEELAGIGP